jgi:hypothetical protein
MLGLKALAESFGMIVRNPLALFRVSAFWFPVYLMSHLCWIYWDYAALGMSDPDGAKPGIFSQWSPVFIVLATAITVLSFIGIAIVAIAWHRFFLKGEVPSSLLIWPKGWAVKRYFWTMVLLVLFSLPFLFVFMFFYMGSFDGIESTNTNLYGFWGMFIPSVIFYMVVSFFGLVFPAIALGVRLRLSASVELMSQHLGTVLVLIFVLATMNSISIVLSEEFVDPGLGLFRWLSFLASESVFWFFVLVEVGVLSSLYRQLGLPLSIGEQAS